MTAILDDLKAVLDADAERRAAMTAAAKSAPDPTGIDPAGHPARVRLMGGWPREAWPVFSGISRMLTPYGYALSPLHPLPSGRALEPVRALQTELYRPETTSDAPFAPLVFALDERAGSLRVFIQQFGGRPAPDFPERHVSVHDPVDTAWLDGVLREYVRCMLRPRPEAV